MQGNFDKALTHSSLPIDELREAQLAVVGTSFDADKYAISYPVMAAPSTPTLGVPPIPVLPQSLDVTPAVGSVNSNVKAHAALEPRLWDLYCQARKMQNVK